MPRTRLFTMRMNAEEYLRADIVASHYSLEMAALYRMLIKREYDLLQKKK